MDSYKNKVITSVKGNLHEVIENIAALVHNNDEVDNRTIANTLVVDMRTIQHTRKKLEKSKDSHGVITRAPKSLDDCRKSRDADFVKRVEAMIDINPSKFMRSMAAEQGLIKGQFNDVQTRIYTAKATECKLANF